MVNGVVRFVPPEEIPQEMKREIRPMKEKRFGKELNNFTGLEEEALKQEMAWEEGKENGLDAEAVRSV